MSTISSGLRAALVLLLSSGLDWRPASAAPLITEFMASNKTTLTDSDGNFSDWIEIYNPDAAPVDLDGWHLTDNASKKTKWTFPAVTLPAGGYLVVFADDKDRRDPAGELHTNFSLSADGEYLGLIEPDGVTAASEFAPAFPAQAADISYGRGPGSTGLFSASGFLISPTPGAPNDRLSLGERVLIEPASRTFVGQLSIALSGAEAGQVIRYEIAPPSAAGVEIPEPTAASPEYSGPFTISSSVTIRAAVFAADNSLHGAAATAQFIRIADDGARLDTFSSPLPLVVLDTHGRSALDDNSPDQKPAWLQLFTPDNGSATLTAPPAVTTPIGVKVRGTSSAGFPKKSYSVELHDEAGADRPLSLLGLAHNADWALVGPWAYDRSYIRNAFVYALSNEIGRWAPRTRFAEIFVKTDGDKLTMDHYAGITILTERIKVAPDLVAISSLSASDVTAPAITGGYILAFDPKDDDEYGWITDHGIPSNVGNSQGTMLVLATPKADKLPAVQRDYIRGYVQDFENALFADRDASWATRRYLDYIDLPSWVDFHLLNVFTGNVDGLERSAFFTKDRDGKIKAGPVWDYDRALSSTDPRSPAWNEWSGAPGTVDFWNSGWWELLTRDPDFMQAWIDRWQSLRTTAFANARLTELASSLAAEVPAEAAARDAARWPDNVSRFGGSFLGEVEYLKNYLLLRAFWIDQQFTAAPQVTHESGLSRISAPAGATLVYTLDGSDPRAPGGGYSAHAFFSSAPLEFSGEAIVNVRVHQPAASFPGSPWSSLRTITIGANGEVPPAAGLAPPARLFNLSARATVEAGGILINGVVVTGDTPKRFLARAAGPALAAFDVADALADPILQVVDASGTELARNAGWSTGADNASLAAFAASVGAFPFAPGSHDDAVVITLAPGMYTLHVTSATGQRGAVLAELYALDEVSARLNLSSRSYVRGTEQLLIGGITVDGQSPRRLLLRAVGPTLAAYGVTDPLPDPVLTLFSGQNVIAFNDNWDPAADAAATAVGAFKLPSGTKDAALVISLEPGGYTFQVAGKDQTSGTALIEVYEIP